MKSAEEFMLNMLKIFDSNAQFPEVMSPEEKVEWNKVVMIYNQNQLDAFKAGMERAAGYIFKYDYAMSIKVSQLATSLTIEDLK